LSSVLNHRLAENVCDSIQGMLDIMSKLDATPCVPCAKIAQEFAFFCRLQLYITGVCHLMQN